MKISITVICFSVIIWMSICSSFSQRRCQYICFQTFDEYKVEGVSNKRVKHPCAFVKKNQDTIFVVKSNDKANIIKYINCGYYWHSVVQIKEKSSYEDRKRICEKFIYNDTVIEYVYILKSNDTRFGQEILINTKEKCIVIPLCDNDINNYSAPFDEIMEILEKRIMNSDASPSLYQPIIYEKQIEGNIMSVYITDETNKKQAASKRMNNLGEFDNQGSLAWWW